jgi:2'-5' RNA ligase
MTESLLINVAIIPPAHASEVIVDLASRLPEDAPLRVDGTNFAAHLTLYMARFDARNIELVLSHVLRSLAREHAFAVRQIGFNVTAGRYYEVSYERSRRLMRIHRAVTRTLSDLRYRPGKPRRESYFEPYSHDQQRHAARTGYDLSGRLYRPHITIGRLAREGTETSIPHSTRSLSFRAEKVGIFRADENGAAQEVLEAHTLRRYRRRHR